MSKPKSDMPECASPSEFDAATAASFEQYSDGGYHNNREYLYYQKSQPQQSAQCYQPKDHSKWLTNPREEVNEYDVHMRTRRVRPGFHGDEDRDADHNWGQRLMDQVLRLMDAYARDFTQYSELQEKRKCLLDHGILGRGERYRKRVWYQDGERLVEDKEDEVFGGA